MAAAELAELRDAVRAVCADAGGTAAVRSLGASWDEKSWAALAGDIGLAGLGLPDEAGGVGGLAEVVVVCEELGRSLLPVPFLSSTVLAGQVLAGCGASAHDAVASVAQGHVFALAVAGADGAWTPGEVTVTAHREGADWALTGTGSFVHDGTGAEGFVVAAGVDGGVDLFLVPAGNASVRSMSTLDLSRGQAEITLSAAPAVRLSSGGAGASIVDRALDFALVALAAEQLGGAQACLETTVSYVGTRRQFSREIGSFQAVKHRCADMLVQVEYCRSAVDSAVRAAHDPRALAEAAAVAQIWCSDAFVEIAGETVHLHGGIGFTWEHDAHLYFRRARADAAAFGGSAHHRERLARLLRW
jgi:alkylation response protein AidB-like acyl-CoA dehydrogenase